MYYIRIEHVPGYGTRDHLFPDFQACFAYWQRPMGYATRDGARHVVKRFGRRARQRTTFDGNYSVYIDQR